MRKEPHPVSATAPGSLMLSGEHAVLHGAHALCAAIDQHITARLLPRRDRLVHIQSALGFLETDLDQLESRPPFTFVLAALRGADLSRGVELDITAEFASTLGFGSSAAVTVACVAALRAARGEPMDRAAVFTESLRILHEVQGRGSGADLAAACFGGVVLYRADPLMIDPLICDLPLNASYTGYKTPTAEVIKQLDRHWSGRENERAGLFGAMDRLSLQCAAAIRHGDVTELGRLFQKHQELQAALGCSDETTDRLLADLQTQPQILGGKISGSGRGDCVISLGSPPPVLAGFDTYPLRVTPTGVRLE